MCVKRGRLCCSGSLQPDREILSFLQFHCHLSLIATKSSSRSNSNQVTRWISLTNLHCPSCVAQDTLYALQPGPTSTLPSLITFRVTAEHESYLSTATIKYVLYTKGFDLCSITSTLENVSLPTSTRFVGKNWLSLNRSTSCRPWHPCILQCPTKKSPGSVADVMSL